MTTVKLYRLLHWYYETVGLPYQHSLLPLCLNTRSEHDMATVKLNLLLSWYYEAVALRYQSNVYY